MNLLIDIGNTRIKTALFDSKNKLVQENVIPVKQIVKKLDTLLKYYPVTHALISTTGKTLGIIESILDKKEIIFFYLNTRLRLPFQLDYENEEKLGADRIALAAGAIQKAPNKNRLIIDAGTCITYDFIDNKNIFRGGAISPGIDLRLKSMHDYTANLPLINLDSLQENIPLTGKDTIACMKSGAVRGAANEIESFIVKYKLKHKDLTVFLTGGSQIILERYLKNKIFVNSKFLLFEGMNVILNMNK